MEGSLRLNLFARIRTIALTLLFAIAALCASGQACDCPSISTCSACAGGLSSLTLKFNDTAPHAIQAFDQSGQLFIGAVSPGGTFTFSSKTPNDKFAGSAVELWIDGTPDASILVACGASSFVGSTFGHFTITAGKSKSGGNLCCSAATMEKIKPQISSTTNINKTLPTTGVTNCSMAVTWTAPTATDNCAVETFGPNIAPGSSFPVGSTTVTYTATDPYGNSSTASFFVKITDTAKPEISACPSTITVSAGANCNGVATWTPPTVTDNCSAVFDPPSHNPGDLFPLGTTVVKYTAKDPSGNTAVCTFNVVVVDDEDPQITNCPTDVVVDAGDNCESNATWIEPTATDNCSLASFSPDHAPGSKFSLGTTPVTYTATDAKGNTKTCVFNVIVRNGSDPVVSGCPNEINLEGDENDQAIATWEEPTASVQCGGVSMTRSHEPGTKFSIGTTTVTYEFTDDFGNKSVCSFNVTVTSAVLDIEVGKALTLDGNGINDFWLIKHIERFKDNSVLVVDRWGNKVYSATGYNNTDIYWDGTNSSGAKVPTGTYFYTVEVRLRDAVIEKKGFLEVIQ